MNEFNPKPRSRWDRCASHFAALALSGAILVSCSGDSDNPTPTVAPTNEAVPVVPTEEQLICPPPDKSPECN